MMLNCVNVYIILNLVPTPVLYYIERAVNAAQSRKNGLNAEERLEGFHWGVADWHAGMKLCSVRFLMLRMTRHMSK